jgi:hypothetical protein
MSEGPFLNQAPEPVASLHTARISAEHKSQVAAANACKFLRIGI